MPRMVPALAPRSAPQTLGAPPPASLTQARIALALGQLAEARELLAGVTAGHATPALLEGFTLAAEAALELRAITEARTLIRRAATECGFDLHDLNAGKAGVDYTTAQLYFDAGILEAQAAIALGAAPEPVWFNQAIFSPDGVFCLADQQGRRLIACDSGGHILWGKQLPTRNPLASGDPKAVSLLLSQRPDEGLSYIDNHYRDFARLNRFAVYQTLAPLERTHLYGSFTQDFFGNVYATCADGRTIAIYTEDGTPIKEISLEAIDIAAPAMPFSILGDDDGHIYLYDTQVLVVLDRYGHVLFRHGFPPSPIPTCLASGLPGGMHLTSDGYLYLVRPTEGRIIKVHPEREEVVESIGPDLATGPLVFPVDVLADWNENLYIVDAGAGRVLRLERNGGTSVLFERPYWAGIRPFDPVALPHLA